MSSNRPTDSAKTIDSFGKGILLRAGVTLLIVWAAHIVLVREVLPPIYAASQYWLIDAFLVTVTIIGVLYLYKSHKKRKGNIIKPYIIFTTLKVILCLAFLSPWLIWKDEFSKPMVFQFFGVFFPTLFIETFVLVRLLNRSFDED